MKNRVAPGLTEPVSVHVRHTEKLDEKELKELKGMLESVFGKERYTQESWEHCLGGIHYLLRYGDKLVAHGALVPRYLRQGDMELRGVYGESMATLSDWRNLGFGTAIVALATAEIRRNYDIGVFAGSRYGFYRRLGWDKWRGPTFVETARGIELKGPDRGAVMFWLPDHSIVDPDADLTTISRSGDDW
ncbi:GNAT family N-acetyltransferase [Streptomyces griseorubiginosus]|uniref:GNAT family N-acetyltransferase n=1 Tax=Streptomyces griseorubiginosus TaxID=67304 RepID=UPI00363F9987